MKRTVRCLVLLALGAGAWACRGNPTDELGRGEATELTADPTVVFIDQGATVGVILEARDNLNQVVSLSGLSATAGAGATVARDEEYNRIFNENGDLVLPENPTRARYEVTGNSPVETSVTFNANGLSLTVPVRVVPQVLTGALSNVTPALGEDVTVALPGALVIDPAIVGDPAMWPGLVTFEEGPDALISDVQAQTITMQVGPNVSGPASVHNVIMPYATAAGALTLDTEEEVTTQVIDEVPITLSDPTPDGAALITITAGAGFSFLPGATAAIGLGCPGASPACETGITESVAPDGSSMVVALPAEGDGTVFISGVAANAAPQFGLAIPSDQTATVGPAVPAGDPHDPFAAPIINFPAAGNTIHVYDGGPFGGGTLAADDSRYWRFTLAAETTFDIGLIWNPGVHGDLGVYTVDGAFTALQNCTADASAAQDGGPETAECTLPAGDYVFAVVTFDIAAINVYQIEITVQ